MNEQERYHAWKLHSEGVGYKKIADELGINVNTVKTYLRRLGGASPSVRCEECGKTIHQVPRQKPRRFCSDECRLKWWSQHPYAGNRKPYHLTCEYCGKEFDANDKKRKYCSTSCAAKGRNQTRQEARQKSFEKANPCGAKLSSLPANCRCPSCEWFTDGKRSCPCKKAVDQNL